ncbi:hypothetical protein [Lysobacter capsici]|uniref:hypothetical protein n=1 Tax=Lysobacter capsici TaxID=435897 RepID=UPI0012FDA210|nr:hypothetical protein [Lysobacter capsici]
MSHSRVSSSSLVGARDQRQASAIRIGHGIEADLRSFRAAPGCACPYRRGIRLSGANAGVPRFAATRVESVGRLKLVPTKYPAADWSIARRLSAPDAAVSYHGNRNSPASTRSRAGFTLRSTGSIAVSSFRSQAASPARAAHYALLHASTRTPP